MEGHIFVQLPESYTNRHILERIIWREKFSSCLGYSAIYTENSDGQYADAFREGKYASANLLYYPLPNMTAGVELQWINRENYNDGWNSSATKIQFSFRYSFKQQL